MGRYRRSALLAAAPVLLVAACGLFDEDDFECPTCSDRVSLEAPGSYGRFVLERAGGDGTARKIRDRCGWNIHAGRVGGSGSTLEIASCGNEGAILVWAFGTFFGIEVSEGWEGTTERGTVIGTPQATFLDTYPEFGPGLFVERRYVADGSPGATSCFDESGVLTRLIVNFGAAETNCPERLEFTPFITEVPDSVTRELQIPHHTHVYGLGPPSDPDPPVSARVDISVSSSDLASVCLEIKDIGEGDVVLPIQNGERICNVGALTRRIDLEVGGLAAYYVHVSSDDPSTGTYLLSFTCPDSIVDYARGRFCG